MRIGEFNQILQLATENDGTLETSGEAIYGGQAYKIKNFKYKAKLVSALDQLELLPDTVEPSTVKLILEHASENEYRPEAAEHQLIVALFTQINSKLPTYSEIAESFSPNQEETVVNVKLPDNISSIKQLQDFNHRLDILFKKFNITGNFKITGFDTGSSWYQVLIDNKDLFSIFLASVSLALQIIDFRDKKKGSDDLRLTKKVLDAQDTDCNITEDQLLEGFVDEKISEDVTTIVDDLGCPDNREKPETISMIVGAVKELVKEIDSGAEFHLSLNPPKWASENGGGKLVIDYKNIPKLEIETPKTKGHIEPGSKSETGGEENK